LDTGRRRWKTNFCPHFFCTDEKRERSVRAKKEADISVRVEKMMGRWQEKCHSKHAKKYLPVEETGVGVLGRQNALGTAAGTQD
jgi:hypothetical protein